MHNTYGLIILPTSSVPRHSSSFLCLVFVPLIDRDNQGEVSAGVLISDPGRIYDEIIPNVLRWSFAVMSQLTTTETGRFVFNYNSLLSVVTWRKNGN